MPYFHAKWLWLGVLVTAVFWGAGLRDAWQWNSRAILFLKGEPIAVAVSGCDHIWLVGAEIGRRGNLTEQRQLWEQALGCSPGNLSLLQIILPQDVAMARRATQLYPDSSQAWFWLAEAQGGFINYNFTAVTNANRAEIAGLLQRGLSLSPHDGLRWRELGDLLRQVDKPAAIEAYLQSCFNGDPGSNGCWLAGHVAEEMGDIETAIRYYRYSRWQGSLDRADELEMQLAAP